jgi:hypothetical protein
MPKEKYKINSLLHARSDRRRTTKLIAARYLDWWVQQLRERDLDPVIIKTLSVGMPAKARDSKAINEAIHFFIELLHRRMRKFHTQLVEQGFYKVDISQRGNKSGKHTSTTPKRRRSKKVESDERRGS